MGGKSKGSWAVNGDLLLIASGPRCWFSCYVCANPPARRSLFCGLSDLLYISSPRIISTRFVYVSAGSILTVGPKRKNKKRSGPTALLFCGILRERCTGRGELR